MEIKELLSVSPENLAERQLVQLKAATIQRLNKATKLISMERFTEVQEMMSNSPAADDIGTDRNYICFNDFIDGGNDGSDLYDVLEKMKSLKSISDGK